LANVRKEQYQLNSPIRALGLSSRKMTAQKREKGRFPVYRRKVPG